MPDPVRLISLTAQGDGQEADFPSAAEQYVRIRDVFEPHEERHARYDELFEQFLAIRESTLPIWKRMADDRARSGPAEA